MEVFDSNLIVFQKIFQVPKILETYLNCEDDLLKGSKKMDLFSFGSNNCMALFLGSKFNKKDLCHYFLTEMKAGFPVGIEKIQLDEVLDGTLFPNFMNLKIIRKDIIEKEYKDFTIENFLKNFESEKFYLNGLF